MNRLMFLKEMKKLSDYYLKDMTDDQLTTWYEVFSDKSIEVFKRVVKKIGTENKFFPNCSELINEYNKQLPGYLHDVLDGNKTISEYKKKELNDLIDWYKLNEYPKEFLKEIMNYNIQIENKKQDLIEVKDV